jgi:hypothetical protein
MEGSEMAAQQSLDVDAEPGVLWRIWSDTAKWPDWNPNVKAISLDGPFAAGTTGSMSTNVGKTHKIEIASVNPPRSFRLDAWPIPLTTFHFDCTIEPRAGGGSTITQAVSFGGVGGVLGPMMGKQVAATFVDILTALKAKAEAEAKPAAESKPEDEAMPAAESTPEDETAADSTPSD